MAVSRVELAAQEEEVEISVSGLLASKSSATRLPVLPLATYPISLRMEGLYTPEIMAHQRANGCMPLLLCKLLWLGQNQELLVYWSGLDYLRIPIGTVVPTK